MAKEKDFKAPKFVVQNESYVASPLSFNLLAVPDASFDTVITPIDLGVDVGNAGEIVSARLSVAFSPTTAISSVALTSIIVGTTFNTLPTVTVSPALPYTMTSANNVTFSFPYSNPQLSSIYDGSVYTNVFYVTACYGAAGLLSAVTDTIAVGFSGGKFIEDRETVSIIYPSIAEHSRLYINGEI